MSLLPSTRPLRLLTLAVAAAAAAACARPRDVLAPVPGAIVVAYPDSARNVIEAAAWALLDEGIPLRFSDMRRPYVESEWIDVTSLRTSELVTSVSGPDRIVKFQSRARRTFGATELVGEAIAMPLVGESRAQERMVPPEHPAREVLQRAFQRVTRRLEERRADQAEETRTP